MNAKEKKEQKKKKKKNNESIVDIHTRTRQPQEREGGWREEAHDDDKVRLTTALPPLSMPRTHNE